MCTFWNFDALTLIPYKFYSLFYIKNSAAYIGDTDFLIRKTKAHESILHSVALLGIWFFWINISGPQNTDPRVSS